MIYIYKILSIIIIPFIKLNLKKRIFQKKELHSRYKERYGIASKKFNENRKVIWIHAASVGEFKSTEYFINKYHKNYNILITTTTLSAANYAIKYFGEKIIHQFAPFDITIWVNKFLMYWKPSLIIWIESDLWPNTLNAIHKKNIKSLLVNLRISPKSYKKWKLVPKFYRSLLECFDEIFTQSELDKYRVESLLKKQVKFIGNLKITNTSDYLKKNIIKKREFNSNIIQIMFSNTHNYEEELLIPIIKELQNKFNFIKIIIAPRHPERSKKIISMFNSYEIKVDLETNINKNQKNIFIINSFGILSKYYISTDIVFLGGSIINAGGHNPIEPALNKCAILTGSKIFNWQNIYDDMFFKKSCIIVKNIDQLKKQIMDLITNKNKIEDLKINGYNFAKKQYVNTHMLDKIILESLKNV